MSDLEVRGVTDVAKDMVEIAELAKAVKEKMRTRFDETKALLAEAHSVSEAFQDANDSLRAALRPGSNSANAPKDNGERN